uniref:Histidine--tRNA ligase, chloroplastic n=1 Tax=Bostrychia simpliciuscula TaxID=324754 RepID=A0A1Z1M846_9FLOR|nr:Histidine-tRNA ligase [Bostrychia simpliciuscula]ARW62176.1 Histidine-tRNA ligase [Bostrychia simpliciuscula]
MKPLRGTKDILPDEIIVWQYVYSIAYEILTLYNYKEIRTPLLENTILFNRSIGNYTDIVNKEMYSFLDQGERNISLRPEGTASIARAFISNKLYLRKKINRLWYLGAMFRYERPQKGRQRQFHQLGIECIGSPNPIADVEVIRLATKILKALKCLEYKLEINSIGNIEERNLYQTQLINYLNKYKYELDISSQNQLKTNPLRILDSKNSKTQEILWEGPKLKDFLKSKSLDHFNEICNHLNSLNISYEINEYLVRGLDYYNYTAFEIKEQSLGSQNTICGGGRYDQLIQQLGGPKTPSVGWAIGIERLVIITQNQLKIQQDNKKIYIAVQIQSNKIRNQIWDIIKTLEELKINFELDLSHSSLHKQIKQANQISAKICFIIGEEEIKNEYITVKWLQTGTQQKIKLNKLKNYLIYLKNGI